MKLRIRNISQYWKYQMLGWLSYAIIFCGIDAYKQNLPLDKTFPYVLIGGVLIVITGLFLSHQMRRLIIKLRILEQTGTQQVVYLLLFTCLFTLLFWIVFNLTINKSSVVLAIKNIFSENARYRRWFLSQYSTFSISFLVWNLAYFIFHYIRKGKLAEEQKFNQKRKLVELEARALRAQMNPHFIFNCLNSIKSLIQQNENEKSVTYLTTFSKLIRTLFNNADKKEISLYDEIETCKLYLQLEAMRFDTKFSYAVNVDENIDLKSIQIPALIIQPFIENAIWHGIVPRNNGGRISLSVLKKDGLVQVIIDDNGIGRKSSQQNKSASTLAHQSKGVNLTQTRLELNNLLLQRQASLEVIDKKDEKGASTGTTVIIKIKEEQS